MLLRSRPDDCQARDCVLKTAIADWPLMTTEAASAFKRFTGQKTIQGRLYRKGRRIFEVGDSELALCVYNHTREF